MKRLLLLLCLFNLTANCQSQDSIIFKKDPIDVLKAKAKETHKPLFVYTYSPGCHFCKKMETAVFTQAAVANYYNTTFINTKVNLEEGEGLVLAKALNIVAFPTYVYFDEDGNLLHISGAEKPADGFIADAKNAFDSTRALAILKRKYNEHQSSTELTYNFIQALKYANTGNSLKDSVIRQYLQQLPKEELSTKKNMQLIFDQTSDMASPTADYYFKLQQTLIALFGQEAVTANNRRIVGMSAMDAGREKDSVKLHQLQNMLLSLNTADAAQLSALSKVKFVLGYFTMNKSAWQLLAREAKLYTKQYINRDNYMATEAATYLYYFAEDKNALVTATWLVNEAVKKNMSYDNFLLQAKILHKAGEKQKALAVAKLALEKAIAAHEDTTDVKELIADIKKA